MCVCVGGSKSVEKRGPWGLDSSLMIGAEPAENPWCSKFIHNHGSLLLSQCLKGSFATQTRLIGSHDMTTERAFFAWIRLSAVVDWLYKNWRWWLTCHTINPSPHLTITATPRGSHWQCHPPQPSQSCMICESGRQNLNTRYQTKPLTTTPYCLLCILILFQESTTFLHGMAKTKGMLSSIIFRISSKNKNKTKG